MVGVEQRLRQKSLHVVVRGGVVDEGAFAAACDQAGQPELRQVLTDRGRGRACEFGEAGDRGLTLQQCPEDLDRITVGGEIGSAALVADGLHARTDGFTSLAVVLGAAGVALGFPLADPIIGLGITVAILFVLRDAAKEVFRRLMDAVDPATVDLAEHTAREVPGVLDAGDVRMRWIGHSLRAELAVTVNAALSVEQAHRVAHDVEHRLVPAVARLTAAVVHTEPATGAETAHDTLTHHR